MSDRPSRREFVALGAGIAVSSLAGCLDGGGSDSTPTDDSAATDPTDDPSQSTDATDDATASAADTLVPVSVDESWTRYRYTRANTGASPNAGPDAKPVLRWHRTFDEGVQGSPVVADGTLYVGSYGGGTAYALDAASGDTLWQQQLGTAIDVSPTVVDDTAYFVMDNELYALDRASGEELWSVSENLAYDVPPLVVDGTVYLSEEADNLHAYDAETGDELVAAAYEGTAKGSLAYASGTVFVSSFGGITAIDTSDHSIAWTQTIEGESQYGPAVADGAIYLSGEQLHAFDAETGDELWTFDGLDKPNGVPAIRDGVVYVGASNQQEYALNAEDGSERWSSSIGPSPQRTLSSKAMFVSQIQKNVVAFDPATGDRRWAFEGPEIGTTSVIPASGLLFYGDSDGVTAVEAPA